MSNNKSDIYISTSHKYIIRFTTHQNEEYICIANLNWIAGYTKVIKSLDLKMSLLYFRNGNYKWIDVKLLTNEIPKGIRNDYESRTLYQAMIGSIAKYFVVYNPDVKIETFTNKVKLDIKPVKNLLHCFLYNISFSYGRDGFRMFFHKDDLEKPPRRDKILLSFKKFLTGYSDRQIKNISKMCMYLYEISYGNVCKMYEEICSDLLDKNVSVQDSVLTYGFVRSGMLLNTIDKLNAWDCAKKYDCLYLDQLNGLGTEKREVRKKKQVFVHNALTYMLIRIQVDDDDAYNGLLLVVDNLILRTEND